MLSSFNPVFFDEKCFDQLFVISYLNLLRNCFFNSAFNISKRLNFFLRINTKDRNLLTYMPIEATL